LRVTPGMPAPASSDMDGCQSMGFRRSSKPSEALNFHFLMIVQITATRPIDPAMATRITTVVFATLLADPEATAAELVAAAALP